MLDTALWGSVAPIFDRVPVKLGAEEDTPVSKSADAAVVAVKPRAQPILTVVSFRVPRGVVSLMVSVPYY